MASFGIGREEVLTLGLDAFFLVYQDCVMEDLYVLYKKE